MKFLWRFSAVLLCWPVIGYADIANNKKHELDYLLHFVRDSGCHIDIRGRNLSGLYASAHFQQQYELQKEHIRSVEDFIDTVAAKSSSVGQYSMVACPQKSPVRAVDWLQRALSVYRLRRRF